MTQPAALLEVALAHHRNGRLDQADSLYRRLLDLDEFAAQAHRLLGLLEQQRGRPAAAASRLRAAIALGPADAQCWTDLGAIGLFLDPLNAEALGQVARGEVIAGRSGRLGLHPLRAAEGHTNSPIAPVTFTDDRGAAIAIAPFVLDLSDATVTSDFLVIDAKSAVLLEGMVPDPADPGQLAPNLVVHARRSVVLRHHKKRTLDRGVLLGGSRNYYHWLIDFLPRLALLDGRLNDGKLIINASPERFQVEALSHLGIDADRLVEIDATTELEIGRLTVPSMMSGFSLVHPRSVAWLRERFVPAHAAGRRRFYVSRSGALRRRLIDENAVFAALAPFGFELVRTESMSFQAQVALFASAETVVAAHGAALANVVFSPPGCRIVEIDARGSRRSFFSVLALLVGAVHVRVSGEPQDPVDLQYSAIELGEAGLAELLRAVG